MLVISILLFSQCKKAEIDKYCDDTTPNASYECYLSTDSTKLNPDSIIINQSLVFKSLKNLDGGNAYAVYTGTTGNEYTYYVNDSLHKGTGILLTKVNGVFTSTAIAFLKVGTYKIYMVASVINDRTGKVKRTIDSSRTITVYDPNSKIAELESFGMSQPSTIPATIDQTNAKIQFLNMTAIGNFQTTCMVSYTATGSKVSLSNDTGKTYKLISTSTKVKIPNGSKIKVEANEGGAYKEYTIEVKAYINPKIVSATVKQVSSDFPFSGKATITGNTITLPSWPQGTTECQVTVSATGIADNVYTIQKKDMPKTITSTAPDCTPINYTIVAPASEISASIADLSLTNKTGSIIVKQIGSNYEIVAENAADLKAAKLNFTIGSFTKVQYTSNSDFVTGLADFSSGTTSLDFSTNSTYYFVATCGTSVIKFSVKMTAF